MLLLLILLPLAGALPLLLNRSESETRLGRWSCAVTGLTLLVMVLAVCTRFGESLDIPLCGIRFTLDGFRCIYGLVVSFMWFVSALLTPQYFRGHHHLRRYHFFFLLFSREFHHAIVVIPKGGCRTNHHIASLQVFILL